LGAESVLRFFGSLFAAANCVYSQGRTDLLQFGTLSLKNCSETQGLTLDKVLRIFLRSDFNPAQRHSPILRQTLLGENPATTAVRRIDTGYHICDLVH
jgi:hypothetical protein